MLSETERIGRLTNTTIHSCTCNTCQEMCLRAPCLGTPADILQLINNGYGHYLRGTTWMVAASMNAGPPIHMVQIKQTATGGCPLFVNGRCSIHHLGIKPTEGALVAHKAENIKAMSAQASVSFAVANEWTRDENSKAVLLIVKALNTYHP